MRRPRPPHRKRRRQDEGETSAAGAQREDDRFQGGGGWEGTEQGHNAPSPNVSDPDWPSVAEGLAGQREIASTSAAHVNRVSSGGMPTHASGIQIRNLNPVQGIAVDAGWGQLGMTGPAQGYVGDVPENTHFVPPVRVRLAQARTSREPYSVPELSNTSDSETEDSQNAEPPNAHIEAVEVHDPRYIYI